MRTPAGRECSYFFGDYFRGRQQEECRLLADAQPPLRWSPDLCASCPVPDIELANACPHLVLKPELGRPFPFLRQQVRVQAYCDKSNRTVKEPRIGCGQCHQLPAAFTGDILDPDTAA
jgi:hypothetical protein